MAVLKIIELVGLSTEGWSAAARAAVAEASKTIRHIEELEVLRSTARVREGAIVEYRVAVKLTFRVEDSDEPLVAVEQAEAILASSANGEDEEAPIVLVPEPLLEEADRPGGARQP
jgi:flavin-binding protein dodecin